MRTIEPNPAWSPYPIGRIVEACRSIEHDASFFLAGFDDMPALEMGLAPTERASLPFIEHETSNGVPSPMIGDEEVTKPAHAPRTSTAVFTESEALMGGCRAEGMRW